MAHRYKSSDADNSDLPRRLPRMLPLSESMEVLNLRRKEIKLYAEVSKLCGKNASSTCETGRKEKKIHASLAVAPQTAKSQGPSV